MTMIDTDHPIHEQIDAARDASAASVPPDVRDYYDGRQPPVVTPEERNALGDRANRELVENMLQRCVDTIAGRLLFDRYVVDDENVQEALTSFAAKNHLTRRVIANTVRALVDGNAANSLAWDKVSGRPIVYQESWWDGEEGMYVESSENGVEEWAVKEWTDTTKSKRRTVYLPDMILRYRRDGEAWVPYPDESEYIQPWTKGEGGEPLGVPVIHFANVGAASSVYGASKIEPLLGLQDALNGALFDIVAAQAMTAFGIYTATGVNTDTTGLHVGPGRLWKTDNADAKFGLLSGAAMDSLLDGYRTIRMAIASQFPVAEHIISGDWPSGLAMVKAESQMTGYVKLLGDTWAPAYVRLAHRATEMMNAFGGAGLNEDETIRIAYDAPEQLDDGTVAEIDRERVNTYDVLSRLPKTLMVKSGMVTEDEAATIDSERANSMSLIADVGF